MHIPEDQLFTLILLLKQLNDLLVATHQTITRSQSVPPEFIEVSKLDPHFAYLFSFILSLLSAIYDVDQLHFFIVSSNMKLGNKTRKKVERSILSRRKLHLNLTFYF